MEGGAYYAYQGNPKIGAGIINRLFFGWLIPIFIRGKNHDLEPKDLYETLPENRSKYVTDKLEKYWETEIVDAEKKMTKPSLLKAVKRTFQWSFYKYAIHSVILHLVIKIIQPMIMGLLIWHFDERSTSSSIEAYGYAAAFVLVAFVDQMIFIHTLFGMRTIGISARVACASLMYRKMMKLPYTAKRTTGGKIINLISNDTSKLEFGFLFAHTLWILPLQTILVTYLISRDVGVLAATMGVLSLVCQTIPVQAYSGRVIARLRKKIAKRTDERILITGEIIRGIRVIKMYTWEIPFQRLMFFARRCEINAIATASYLKSGLWAVTAFAQRMPLFITVMLYVLQGNRISAYTMFTLVQYYNILHVMMGSLFLRAVYTLSDAIASIRRIREFLLLEERKPSVKNCQTDDKDTIVSLTGARASTMEKKDVDILHDLDLAIRRKLLYAVVGPVGAGKSSILKLILDELKLTEGQVLVHGDVSYASQEPWLFKDTIKNNILFGETYEEKKYKSVTKACSLTEDFERLANGDETIVGESGITLSGGQCARINLARAVYRNADIYLLDDPLSAVDSRVGQSLFDECLNGLLKDKTRILVTHQLQYLKQADRLIFIDNGRVEYEGDFENFKRTDEIYQYLNVNDAKVIEIVDEKQSNGKSNVSINLNSNIVNKDNEKEDPDETEKLINSKKPVNSTKEKEVIEKSKTSMANRKSMYWKYVTAGNKTYILPLTTLLAFTLAQLFCSGSDYFVAYWTRKEITHKNDSMYESEFKNSKLFEQLNSHTAIFIFGMLMIGIILMSVIKMICYTTVCKRSNKSIHQKMAVNLLGATMKFFDINDSGRILNRFTKDLGTVDERLQVMALETFEFLFIILGTIIQIVLINRWTIFLILIMGYLFWKGRVIAIKTIRDIMRLEGQAKSPVLSYVNSSLTGLLTIRSSRGQSTACKLFDTHQDNHTAVASISQYSLIAYSFWLDLITLTFMAILTNSFVMFRSDQTAGADFGLAVTQVLILCSILARAMRLIGDIETQMVTVERLFEYTRLEQEISSGDEIGQKPSDVWPTTGNIKFHNVYLKYSQDDLPALNNVDFTIEAGSKIGIIGRTGSGKSSLIAALFRLHKIDGSIYIDDIDTKKIELKYLRNKISILPQEPILFSISLRKNLDPLEKFDDASLWSALRDVELNGVFASLDTLLDQNNLSTGQRQLLCLARAIIKKNKILVLDEATANVDANTDALIQQTIRKKFEDCTVLTIAHRLNTIMDCDKILVIDQGKVVEYDSPDVLMKRNNSYFSKMLSQANVAPLEYRSKISNEVRKEE